MEDSTSGTLDSVTLNDTATVSVGEADLITEQPVVKDIAFGIPQHSISYGHAPHQYLESQR